jgi:hypothetical protein
LRVCSQGRAALKRSGTRITRSSGGDRARPRRKQSCPSVWVLKRESPRHGEVGPSARRQEEGTKRRARPPP